MNLSVKKLRRGATVIGGSMLGLGLAAALATPALACNSTIKGDVSCLNADGTWSVTWSVTSDLPDRTGIIKAVDVTPVGAPLTKIVVGETVPAQGDAPLVGVETLTATDTKASIAIKAKFDGERKPIEAKSDWINQPTEKCAPPTTTPTTPPTTPPTTKPTTAPPTTSTTTAPPATSATPAPSTSGPVLAVTGSSSGPLAGGAVAVVLIGGGAFFLARRRKMRFSA